MTQHGQLVAYVRVSTVRQNTARQDAVREGADQVFEEKISASTTDRPKLQEMLAYVRDGDTIRVWSMDRLARKISDLNSMVQQLNDKGVTVRFDKEGLTFEPGRKSAMASLLLNVMGAFAEFERENLLDRQAEGIAKGKAAGKYKGRVKKLNEEQAAKARDLVASKVPKAEIARQLGVSRSTLYRYLTEAAEVSA